MLGQLCQVYRFKSKIHTHRIHLRKIILYDKGLHIDLLTNWSFHKLVFDEPLLAN